jgi:hypothetical protein
MQTTVNVAQAFGLVGEMYDTTPRRVDAYEVVGTGAVMGGVAAFNANGKVGKMDGTTYTKFAGIFVRPHEMVNYGDAGNPLDASIAIAEGVTAQVCSMGRVVINYTLTATSESAANALTLAAGTKIYVTAAGVLTTDAQTGTGSTAVDNTLVGKVIVGIAAGNSGVSGSESSWKKVQTIVLELGC